MANLLKDVCHDVLVEPHLQILTGEVLNSGANSSDEARLDVSVRGFWQSANNEKEKKKQYNQRVIEIDTPYGGNGREAGRFIAELALKLSENCL